MGDRYVVEQGGRIQVVLDGQVQPTPFLDISDRVRTGGERGRPLRCTGREFVGAERPVGGEPRRRRQPTDRLDLDRRDEPAGRRVRRICESASLIAEEPVHAGIREPQIEVTFVLEGNIGFDGDDFRINQSFQVTLADESGLTLLVDVGDPALSETFNYVFAETFQCIRDAIPPPDPESPCSFGCSLERRVCFDESGILFSW